MKYIVKCPYCNNNYSIESESKPQTTAIFLCKTCGGTNSGNDIVTQVIDAQERARRKGLALTVEQKKARERARNLKNLYDDDFEFIGSENKHKDSPATSDLGTSTKSRFYSWEDEYASDTAKSRRRQRKQNPILPSLFATLGIFLFAIILLYILRTLAGV